MSVMSANAASSSPVPQTTLRWFFTAGEINVYPRDSRYRVDVDLLKAPQSKPRGRRPDYLTLNDYSSTPDLDVGANGGCF